MIQVSAKAVLTVNETTCGLSLPTVRSNVDQRPSMPSLECHVRVLFDYPRRRQESRWEGAPIRASFEGEGLRSVDSSRCPEEYGCQRRPHVCGSGAETLFEGECAAMSPVEPCHSVRPSIGCRLVTDCRRAVVVILLQTPIEQADR